MNNINFNEINNKHFHIVSLGYNCLPRTILTRWKLKSSKKEGEKTTPFDLAVFETREITKNIQDDFKNFFENFTYKQTCKTLLKDEGYWIKAPDCIEFLHEKNFNREKIIDTYKKRIENFRQIIIDPTPVLFIQILGDCDDTENLYNTLKQIRKNLPFVFGVIDPFDITTENNPSIHIKKIKYPEENNYKDNWWNKKYYTSKAGISFEIEIVNFCIDLIKTYL